MFSQNRHSPLGSVWRKPGSMMASFGLHCLIAATMAGLPLLFADYGPVEGNGSMVATWSFTPWPGDPQQVLSQPNTRNIPHDEVVTVRPDETSRILPAAAEPVEVPRLPLVLGPNALIPSIDFGLHGACGCVRQIVFPVRQSQLKGAVLVKKIDPQYPSLAKRAGIQGKVVIHAIIDREGAVTVISVESGPQELRTAAVEAIRQWRYEPYVLDGSAIEIETTITVNFVLPGSRGQNLSRTL